MQSRYRQFNDQLSDEARKREKPLKTTPWCRADSSSMEFLAETSAGSSSMEKRSRAHGKVLSRFLGRPGALLEPLLLLWW